MGWYSEGMLFVIFHNKGDAIPSHPPSNQALAVYSKRPQLLRIIFMLNTVYFRVNYFCNFVKKHIKRMTIKKQPLT